MTCISLIVVSTEPFSHGTCRNTAVPTDGNGDIKTLICVLVARPRRCSTIHIVESCPQTKLNGGLSRQHSADEDAVSWLTSYGSWYAYEKKKWHALNQHNFADILGYAIIVLIAGGQEGLIGVEWAMYLFCWETFLTGQQTTAFFGSVTQCRIRLAKRNAHWTGMRRVSNFHWR